MALENTTYTTTHKVTNIDVSDVLAGTSPSNYIAIPKEDSRHEINLSNKNIVKVYIEPDGDEEL